MEIIRKARLFGLVAWCVTNGKCQVKDALANHRPVVALESTIISHGMPYPDNVRCAREVEAIMFTNSRQSIDIIWGIGCFAHAKGS